jgi:hypothetical protein
MRPGYKMLMRCLGEAILGGTLGKREKTLAKALYADMKREGQIYPEWEPAKTIIVRSETLLFGPTPPPPPPTVGEIQKTVVAPAAAAKTDDEVARSLTLKGTTRQKTVTHAKESAGYNGENPLE